ncbi:hypothetical protein IE81DRAFT_328590 [Ceraceosorus guamensis]|uniref:Uncharacterized protein n=1 Tax=Ceraceosorus guamensis TaxID=1522189 RepID=A0A316W4E7_9BASI|nr:hypothetical protein IE81DRAFT_328590 [Ceraceosorus guamensis]PWN44730.1 hypothetical protein IE81DRAFT_328590 [Ceraceosorus guamensis]
MYWLQRITVGVALVFPFLLAAEYDNTCPLLSQCSDHLLHLVSWAAWPVAQKELIAPKACQRRTWPTNAPKVLWSFQPVCNDKLTGLHPLIGIPSCNTSSLRSLACDQESTQTWWTRSGVSWGPRVAEGKVDKLDSTCAARKGQVKVHDGFLHLCCTQRLQSALDSQQTYQPEPHMDKPVPLPLTSLWRKRSTIQSFFKREGTFIVLIA